MGSYLSSIPSDSELNTNCSLVGLSIAKIRELHGGFKSVCDSFAINLTEFESIFQSNQATFSIFDTDSNGKYNHSLFLQFHNPFKLSAIFALF